MSLYILLGSTLALGIWLIAGACLEQNRINFADRIAPQMKTQELRHNRGKSYDSSLGFFAGAKELLSPFISGFLSKILGKTDNASLEKRLVQSGTSQSLTDFRAEQILWAILAFSLSAVLLGAGTLQGEVPFLAALLLSLACACFGFMARDWWLGQKIQKREKDMLAEFPALAELMALSVTAGESAIGALERICKCSQGELAGEFRKILAQTRAGDGLVKSLQDFSQRTSIAALSRFVDGIVVAIERGTPLADVLRAQAQDVRDTAKRDLMETAGKKEIAMMAPIIFCILPLTVIFAIFPGLSLLNLDF